MEITVGKLVEIEKSNGSLQRGILYLPFRVDLDGKSYPAADWEDYAVENLTGWSEELSSKGKLDSRVFEFMDDAWEMRWMPVENDASIGELHIVHRGLGKRLLKQGGVSICSVAQAVNLAITNLVRDLEASGMAYLPAIAAHVARLKASNKKLRNWLAEQD